MRGRASDAVLGSLAAVRAQLLATHSRRWRRQQLQLASGAGATTVAVVEAQMEQRLARHVCDMRELIAAIEQALPTPQNHRVAAGSAASSVRGR